MLPYYRVKTSGKIKIFASIQNFFFSFSECRNYVQTMPGLGPRKLWCTLVSFPSNVTRTTCPIKGKSEAYLEPCQSSMIKFFTKLVNGFQLLINLAKNSMVDVWHGLYFSPCLTVSRRVGEISLNPSNRWDSFRSNS